MDDKPAALMKWIIHLEEQLSDANKVVKRLRAKITEEKAALWRIMQKEGNMEDFRVGNFRATRTETVLPGRKDWAILGPYILETGQLHLLERRVSSTAYRELLEQDGEVPGIDPFVKEDISIRKVKRNG